ncbi:cardioacceleratory peptide receptor-like [Limulus polyphemus]|uniref:Cardioacceleratory peptide receptor-like n=1 Tax=Limulus polyphemus TaxID=6850 RepID=A0ABM1BVA0_LIMPO|nr:cardioacceleratory peptide receptor-like [Limulus polyphemus]
MERCNKSMNLKDAENDQIVNNSTDIGHHQNLYDQPVIKDVRVTTLWILAVLGALGNSFVLFWIWNHRSRKSRVLRLFLNLTIADVLVTVCATGPQLVWEYYGREWRAGDAMCRLVKFLQTFSICVSNYLIVTIALDRYKAIRRPLSPPWKTSSLIIASWALAGIVNASSLVLFRQMEYQDQIVCRNILHDAPLVFLRLYLTIMVMVVFGLPLILISVCYVRIFQKVSQKASENQNSDQEVDRCQKFILRQTPMSHFPRAKSKTLKTTFAIITSFLVCSSPYCIIEMWRVYGQESNIDAMTYSVLAALAVSNSSTNPLVFLIFNFVIRCRRNEGEESEESLPIKIFNQIKRKRNIREKDGTSGVDHSVEEQLRMTTFSRVPSTTSKYQVKGKAQCENV